MGPLSVPVRLRAAAVSDVGAFRLVNQDAAFTAPWGAAVADGVGGGPSGDLASATLVHRLVAGQGEFPDAEALAVRIRGANWDLRARGQLDEAVKGMATTFTGIFIARTGRLLLAHTGDSRAYRLRGGMLVQQTRDDSYVQALLEHGLIAPDEALTHPRRNIITASLSGREHDAVAVTDHDATPADRWLLCSDGVTDYVPDADIAQLLEGTAGPEAAAAAIVRQALEAGTRDNVSAVVCDVEQTTTSRRDGPVGFFGAAAQHFCEDLDTA